MITSRNDPILLRSGRRSPSPPDDTHEPSRAPCEASVAEQSRFALDAISGIDSFESIPAPKVAATPAGAALKGTGPVAPTASFGSLGIVGPLGIDGMAGLA